MKVVVLFNDAGCVGGIFHPASEKQLNSGGFVPQHGQHSAIMEIPPELQHLKPRELHDSVRVEVIGGSPTLVAKTAAPSASLPSKPLPMAGPPGIEAGPVSTTAPSGPLVSRPVSPPGIATGPVSAAAPSEPIAGS
jgi:hypothetical protein